MNMPVLGFLSDLRDEFKELANNLLLVAGGFLVGYLLGWVLAWALNKWVLRLKSADSLQRVCRPLMGIALAIVVALIVFTGKGKPSGEGGDGKGSPSTETAPGKNAPPKAEPAPQPDQKISTPNVDLKPTGQTIRVTVLAGTAVPAEGRFYLLDDDDPQHAMTLAELKKAIEERQARSKEKVTLAIVFPSDPNRSPPQLHFDRKVTDLTLWAKEAGLDVIFPASR